MSKYLVYSAKTINLPPVLNGCTVVGSLEELTAAWKSGRYNPDTVIVVIGITLSSAQWFLLELPADKLPARVCVVTSAILSGMGLRLKTIGRIRGLLPVELDKRLILYPDIASFMLGEPS